MLENTRRILIATFSGIGECVIVAMSRVCGVAWAGCRACILWYGFPRDGYGDRIEAVQWVVQDDGTCDALDMGVCKEQVLVCMERLS